MQLDIIYEDKDILICFKPAGIATQTAKLSSQDMVSILKNYLSKQGGEKSPYVGVIHRLDQPVSGLLVFAKNQKAAASLSRQIQDGNANKDYIAFCTGTLEDKNGTLVHYVAKDSKLSLAKVMDEKEFIENREADKKQTVQINKEDKLIYKKAILTYEVEKEFEDSSIIKVHLQTGRFHQIRGQFSFIGNALLGDAKYGSAESRQLSMKKRINKIALCAYRLVLKHPVTGKEMEFVLEEKYLPEWYKA
ncbi:MAG: RluA family pseudouridine synthase [Lachnospiraceae bacterium]|nr:RluA family pseudouridine synthase [Lachnospiraceae bacterium]